MPNTNRFTTSNIFIVTVISIFFLPALFMQGMFMDGLIYSAIAKNLSLHITNSFSLFMSNTFLFDFHEQPPLSIFMQAFFIKGLGDFFFIDRLFSYVCLIFSLFLLHKIAKKFTLLQNNAWAAILAFLCVPVVSWSFKNNMLENLMCVFTLWSVYLSLSYANNNSNFLKYIFLFSFSLFCAFMCKGFTGLFTLATPFLFSFFKIYKQNKNWIFQTILIVFLVAAIAAISFLIAPQLMDYLSKYLQVQVLASVKGTREVDGHFFIVKRVPQELLVLIAATVLLHLKYKLNCFVIISNKIKTNKQAQLFFLLALCGSLPIVISPKQSGYYVLCSYPFFALFFALINISEIEHLLMRCKILGYENMFRKILVSIFCITVLLCVFNIKRFYRDEEKINLVDAFAAQKPQIKTIDIDWEFAQDYSLLAYFARRHAISLCTPNYKKTTSSFIITTSLSASKNVRCTNVVANKKIFLVSKKKMQP